MSGNAQAKSFFSSLIKDLMVGIYKGPTFMLNLIFTQFVRTVSLQKSGVAQESTLRERLSEEALQVFHLN